MPKRARRRVWAVTVGDSAPPDACPQCGANDWMMTRPGLWEAFVDWLGGGRRHDGPWRAMQWNCRACGCGVSSGAFVLYQAVPQARWTLPARLLRVVADRRTAIPNPLIYLMAAGVGLVVGIALDLLLGWPWWATAAGFLVGVWLVFMSTAFRHHRAGPGQDLWTDLLSEINPQRGTTRRERLEEQMWRSAPLPLYGLPPTWQGPRFVGGWGSGRRGITSLELLHGDALGEGSQLRVEVLADPSDAHPRALADTLWGEAIRPRDVPQSPEEIGAWHRAREREMASRPDPEWQSLSIPIDGEGVAFQLLTEGSWWIAQGRVGELRLILRGHDFPLNQVMLVSVKDIEPYIEGSRRLSETRDGGHPT